MGELREDIMRLALAGLLHDIGKLAQRAGAGSGDHATIGATWVSRLVPEPWRKGLYAVEAHHKTPLPDDRATRIVALADRLSAGERQAKAHQQPQQMRLIFDQISLKGEGEAIGAHYLPLQPLALKQETIFAGSALAREEAQRPYQALWATCRRELEMLRDAHTPQGTLHTYLTNLQFVLQRTTWCVPSAAYRSLPDVSLYDHSRITAALAACLADTPDGEVTALLDALRNWYHADENAPPPAILDQTNVALLVGGDLSGVQDFIYTITARGATSALRGRSFYLQLLTEAVVHFVLRELGLPPTNLIYQGGGNFYLLAPPDAAGRLAEIQRRLSRVLLEHHRGDLYLALAWQPLKAVDFYGGRIAGRWDSLGQELNRVKAQRFAGLGDQLPQLFEPQGHGGNLEQQCQVCGREDPGTKEIREGTITVRKCPACMAFEELGRDLRRARYLWLDAVDAVTPPTGGGWQATLATLGVRAGVGETPPRSTPDGERVLWALDDEALGELQPGPRTAVGRRLLVNVTPVLTEDEHQRLRGEVDDLPVPGSVKPFSVMAAQAQGIKRLGVLRMDVDNLGHLFRDGLGERATLSRMAALSFAISLFFEGWVGEIARQVAAQATNEKRRDTLYAIYSGGDDLFFVGAWDVVVGLAQRIRADLERYTGGHPALHVSGGVALAPAKYPLYQAAEDARRAEEAAKGLRWQRDDGTWARKDALCFLDVPQPWRRFGYGDGAGETVSAWCERLQQLMEDGAPRGLLRTLLDLYRQYSEAAQARASQGTDRNRQGQLQTLYGPWMWRGYYQLTRLAKRAKKKSLKDGINDLADRLHVDDFRAIAWLGIAARWVDLLTRKHS